MLVPATGGVSRAGFVAQGGACATNSGRGGKLLELVAQLPRVAGGDLIDFVMHGAPGLTNGTVMPVPAANRKAYTAAAEKMADLFREYGAGSVVDAWSDDVPEGKVNSFHTAVLRKPYEAVVFSWINWKDQAAHDAGWKKIMADPRMAEFSPATIGADMGRMIYGTFKPLAVA